MDERAPNEQLRRWPERDDERQSEDLSAHEDSLNTRDGSKDTGKVLNEKANEDLLNAARNGESKGVESALREGADIESRSGIGETALHLASRCGHYDVVKYLLDKGANVQIKDHDGWTPLYGAVFGNYENIARLLIGSGSDVDSSTNYGARSLMMASEDGLGQLRWEGIAEELIKKGANSIATQDDQQTPLHKASDKGYPGVVRQLLKHEDPMVDAIDRDGWTALHYASRNGDRETVGLLLGKGADYKLKVPGTEQSVLALAVSALSTAWAENRTPIENEALEKNEDKAETFDSAEKAVSLNAIKTTIVEKQLVLRQLEIQQDDKVKELDRLVNLMDMTESEKEDTKLIWYAARQEYHARDEESGFRATINMLKDPPPVAGMADSYKLDSGPSLGLSDPLVNNPEATMVDFYQRDGRVDFLRRSYPLREMNKPASGSKEGDNSGPTKSQNHPSLSALGKTGSSGNVDFPNLKEESGRDYSGRLSQLLFRKSRRSSETIV
ncbi:ankyrin repeat domain-containing protein [Aspergillus affinis]|uniref:ankyrin repeat domain-containing protein n=1 Tax=Aspergillus affinis TaxID=1070780 RepID=UPI0022FE7DF7|nr:uncharacterized protein KD926_007310 [Aspergillus affinis]KAI9041198.1 hypothetical protein KD926_007310 [Aspergillus affinis]